MMYAGERKNVIQRTNLGNLPNANGETIGVNVREKVMKMRVKILGEEEVAFIGVDHVNSFFFPTSTVVVSVK